MREFKGYSTYPRHKITSSELRFLAELQKEMNTQDTWAQAVPCVWMIKENTIQYLDVINDMIQQDNIREEVIASVLKRADGYQLFIDDNCCQSEEEIYHEILSIINSKENGMHLKTQVRMEDEEVIVTETLFNIDKNISWRGSLEVVDWIKNHTLCEVDLKFYQNITYLHPEIFFFTYEEGMDYLKKFAHHYSDTVSLHMTLLEKTPRIEQLFDILHTVEFSNKNQKIYISGPITGTEDYLDRFADAEEDLKRQGYTNIVNPADEGTKLPEDSSYEDYMKLSFDLMKDCDVIYLLKGWKKSPGANQEYGYAIAKGMEIKYEGIFKKEKSYE